MSSNDAGPSRLIYKILTKEQAVEFESSGVFQGAGIDLTDGFIHMSEQGVRKTLFDCSLAYSKLFSALMDCLTDQVEKTLARFFNGVEDLRLVALPVDAVRKNVRIDKNAHGSFPHIYNDNFDGVGSFQWTDIEWCRDVPLVDGKHQPNFE